MTLNKTKTKRDAGRDDATAKAPALSAERMAAVRAAAEALPPDEVTRMPGSMRARMQRMQRAATAAVAKAAVLVAVPMAPEPALTREELQRTADLVTALGLTIADAGVADASEADASAEKQEAEARKLQATVLHGMRHVFRHDRAARGWVTKVRRGEGVEDLANDATAMVVFWERHAEALSVLTRGEHAALTKMATIAEALRARAYVKSEATAVRRLRDAMYTLAARGLARVRAAAAYAFVAGDPARADFRTSPPKRKKKAKAVVTEEKK